MAFKDTQKQKDYQRDWYARNAEKHKANTKLIREKHRKKIKELLFDYKSTHPCVDCGENDPVVLEFDHLRDKLFCLSDSYKKEYTIEKIKNEIGKCEVRCANCHRRITHKRRLDR